MHTANLSLFMLTLIIWLDYLLFVTSPHRKVLFFLPFHIGPFERQSVTLSSSHVRGGGLTKYQHKLFEILLQERLVSSSYLLIRSIFFFFFYQYGLMHFFFILWVIIHCYLRRSCYSSFGHWVLFLLAPVSL